MIWNSLLKTQISTAQWVYWYNGQDVKQTISKAEESGEDPYVEVVAYKVTSSGLGKLNLAEGMNWHKFRYYSPSNNICLPS